MRMKFAASVLFVFGFTCSVAQKPNIIVIMADDLGYSDIGCYGSEIQTPNLDRLAASGVKFTQFYNAARCCPSRAALLTGMYPHQAGMGGMISKETDRSRETPYQGRLSQHTVTIAEVLKTAGYNTYLSGKWHVGEERPDWPLQRGFDEYFGLISGANSYYKLLPNRLFLRNNDPYELPEDFYMTDAITKEAVDYIGRNTAKKDPFFLYVAYTAPHWPIQAPEDEIAQYKGKYMRGWDKLRQERYAKQQKIGLIPKNLALSERDPSIPVWEAVSDKEEWGLKMSAYAAMVTRMDAGIGKIISKLEAIGQLNNTMIIFLSDNGACAEVLTNRAKQDLNDEDYTRSLTASTGHKDSYVAYDKGWAALGNTPFRLYKQYTHEGGIATPLIVHYPDLIKKSFQTAQVGHIMDILPTCLDLAGAPYPSQFNGRDIKSVEGKSLVPILKSKVRRPHDFLAWEHLDSRAVRQGKWKLVWSRHHKKWELYDLEKDRSEIHDLTKTQPAKAKELLSLYNGWADKVGVGQNSMK